MRKIHTVLFILMAMGLFVALAGPARAQSTIVVNSAADVLANDGFCTLREAITAATSDSDSGATAGECTAGSPGADEITFAGDYIITLDPGLGRLPVSSEMTITGYGPTNTIIQANTGPNIATYRVFEVSVSGNLTLDGVTVRHGNCAGTCATSSFAGGGILNYGTLTVTNSTVSDNSAGDGAGGIGNFGALTVINTTLSGNSANRGGAIFNQGAGAVTMLTNSTLSANSATTDGGGIVNIEGTVTLADSTFTGNTASGSTSRGGGIFNFRGTMTMTNSTFSGNSATLGGGIYLNSYGALTVTNSTFSGNSGNQGGAIYGYGTVTHSTFRANTAFDGGGALFTNLGVLTLTNSLIDDNGAARDACIAGKEGAISGAGNLTNDATCPPFTATSDLGLATTLADNGGPTQTHALLSGSPAIDFVDMCSLSTDQRGVARPQGDGCDVGAYECVEGDSACAPLVDTTPPVAAPTQSPAANGAGWNNSDVTVTWNWSDDGVFIADETNCPVSSTSSGEGVQTLTTTCQDEAGNTGNASYTVKVDTIKPTITAQAADQPNQYGWYNYKKVPISYTCEDAGSGPKGSLVTLFLGAEGTSSSPSRTCEDNAGNVSEPSNVVTVMIDATPPTLAPTVSPKPVPQGEAATTSPNAADAVSGILSASCDPVDTSTVGTRAVMCTATDYAGNTATATATYEVEEAADTTPPTANAGGPYLGAVNTLIDFDGSASTDPEVESLTYAWDFGDNSSDTGATPSHSYADAGIYNVCLEVYDGTLLSEADCTMAVVYDPSAGFVTGGGWIDSPAGAYKADETLSGKATFGFVAKYKKGQTTPDGNTQFQFKAGDLNFHSTSYDWLVVAGANAKFKGVGTINGAGEYSFMITATDSNVPGGGSQDGFRIKIWDADGVVYDNQMGKDDDANDTTAIGGGSIVIHTGKK